MIRSKVQIVTSLTCVVAWSGVAYAQFGRGGAEWMTNGGDAQRTYWIPSDLKISKASLQKPGFQYLWKTKLNNESVQLNSLTPAVLMDRYIGYRGFRSLAFVGGSANNVYAIDTDLNRIEWQHRISPSVPPAGSLNCPGGLTANIARETTAAYPLWDPVGGGLGPGRGAFATSDVGAPEQGAVTIATILAAGPPALAPPRRARPPAVIYAIDGGGMLHTRYISNGEEAEPPATFLPPNANAQGLIVLDGTAYAATHDCNGSATAIWAMELSSKQVSNWKPSAGTIIGVAGPAFGPDGTVYAATNAGELVALDAKTLQVKDNYATGGPAFSSTPVVFPFRGKTLIATASIDGVLHVLDSASLGGPGHKTPLFKTRAYSTKGEFVPGGLASWQSPDGTRWILAAAAGAPASTSGFTTVNGTITNGTIAAFKLTDSFTLQPGWTSRDLISPLPPTIINGVVFAVSSGEYRSGDASMSSAERARRSSPAVVYALDGATGKSLWDSGKTITSFVHSGGISGGAGQLYLQTYDQTIYSFGFPTEH